MDDKRRDDGFEVTFTVATPRQEAWDRLQGAVPASDRIPAPRPGQWWLPGIEGAADELEAVPGERLRVRKATFPCEGTEIVVTMEDADTGTRITIVQTGFGAGFEQQRPWLEAGWQAIKADLYVFFDRGIALGRHLRPWASLGCAVTEGPAGLTVAAVEPGRLAAQAGMQPGDLVVTIDGSPVLTVDELAVVVRMRRSGDMAKIRYLRGTEVLTATGTF